MMFKKLTDTIPAAASVGSIKEAWMIEKEGKLQFRPIPEGATTVITARQIHFLLGGVWLHGDSESKSLREEITQKYLDLERFGTNKEDVRVQLLRQVELDMLQYRLMHKGYQRFYPSIRDEGTEHAEKIDGESTFWDPGYRRIASQLFISRVFLPDLS
jgi:hypothetical protein